MFTSQNVIESLARGMIPQTRSQLFLAKIKTLVLDISGRNEDSQPQTFNLFTRISNASIGKTPQNCQLIGGYSYNSVLAHPVLLNPGDSIDGDCSSGTAVSFEIKGFAI